MTKPMPGGPRLSGPVGTGAGHADPMTATYVGGKTYRGVNGAIKFEDADFQAVVKVFKKLQRWRDELAILGSS